MNSTMIGHRLRWASQYCFVPELAIIGGYYGGNLGDMALGRSVQLYATRRGVSSGLQTIYSLQQWKNIKSAIVGGGAVTYRPLIEGLAARYASRPKSLAILGVDIEDEEALRDHRSFLSETAMFTVRSREQVKLANELLDTDKVTWHPDIAFAFLRPCNHPKIHASSNERALINITPRFHTAKPGAICEDSTLDSPVRLDVLAQGYEEFCRQLCRRWIEDGRPLFHAAFTPKDELTARKILAGFEVNYIPYSSNVLRMAGEFAKGGVTFLSRYHSLIFGLSTRLPVIGFAYADKSVRLLSDLGVKMDEFVSLRDITDPAAIEAKVEVMHKNPLLVEPNVIESAASAAEEAIERCITSVVGPK